MITLTLDSLVDHILEEHGELLRDRFRSIIIAAGEMGADPDLPGLAEHLADEVALPLDDEPDGGLVDCAICKEKELQNVY